MLTARNISISYTETPLFSPVSFLLEERHKLAIKGANGSGKSTLLRLLAGFIAPQENSLFWRDKMISQKNLSAYQQNLLYVGHKLCLYQEALISDQLRLWKNLYRVQEEEMNAALVYWGIHGLKHKKICHLSQGQQKRLSLSRCCWLKRLLWILDEPEAGLDEQGQEKLMDLFNTHLKRNGLIVYATHNPQRTPNEIFL